MGVVVSSPNKGRDWNITIEMPERLRRFLENPTPAFTQTMKEANREVLTLLKQDISRAAPRKSGKLSRGIEVNFAENKVYSKLVYSRAVELGHYAEAKPGHYLRFKGDAQRTGTWVFPTMHYKGKKGFESLRGQWYSGVRSRKQPYFFLTLHRDAQKINAIYDEAFGKIMENA